jgi:hypothetical protein
MNTGKDKPRMNENNGSSIMSKPMGQSTNVNQTGGSDAYYLHKARKYHEKIRMKLIQMEKNGMKCPAGYEKYKVPFSQASY